MTLLIFHLFSVLFVKAATSFSLGNALMLVASPAPSGPTRVADELGVSGSEVSKLYDSLGGESLAVALIEGHMRA